MGLVARVVARPRGPRGCACGMGGGAALRGETPLSVGNVTSRSGKKHVAPECQVLRLGRQERALWRK